MTKISISLILGLFVLITANPALAVLCTNSDVSPTALDCDGSFSGNDDAATINSLNLFGVDDWQFLQRDNTNGSLDTTVDIGLDVTPDGGATSGSWSVTANLAVLYDAIILVLKAGNNWAAYLYDPAINGGNWTTDALDTLNGNGRTLIEHDLSHLSIYARGEDSGKPVPEPATMLLFGTGLVGLAGFSRRKRYKKK